MFSKILIANRGEIACRIIQTAKKLGIKTVAIFSEIDAKAQHVILANEAFKLGPSPSSQSYLNMSKIIEIALASNADAIHPGYGFLAENPMFATQCNDAGITFIGPKPEVIACMGNKDQAKSIVEKAGIPTIPGYHGNDQRLETLIKAAEKIQYPILLKAVAGGGGKGMRLVESAKDLENAITSAKREAQSSFANDSLFIEKYLTISRHVEMQVFADKHGNKLHLFDRDCSIQRRHQKIIEEAPAPYLSDKTRQSMQTAAIKILDTIDYLGAGTIEFMVDEKENFYFMEMNTRLQVEHPITEKVTGLDLVEWQIRVAAGEPLPLQQKDIKIKGHAIEARICAESPYENFIPSIGRLFYLDFPEEDEHIRIDTGVQAEDEISSYYDSMIAKVIAYAPQREDALLQLKEALDETHIVGVKTNTEFLSRILEEKDFIIGKINTNFIEKHPDLFTQAASISFELIAVASLYRTHQLNMMGQQLAHRSEDSNSPWFIRDQWRLNSPELRSFTLWDDSQTFFVEIHDKTIRINHEKNYLTKIIWKNDFQWCVSVNDQSINATVVSLNNAYHIFYHGKRYTLYVSNPNTTEIDPFEAEMYLGSPMPGNIIEVRVKLNQSVKKGDKLITLEAMKMEHHITAPADGTIKAVHCALGDFVSEGTHLIEFEKD